MRKPNTKLVVRREVLRTLSTANLAQAVGCDGVVQYESRTGCPANMGALQPLPRP